jgi:hypothetical protein
MSKWKGSGVSINFSAASMRRDAAAEPTHTKIYMIRGYMTVIAKE